MKAPARPYKKWLVELKNNIQQSRLQTALKVNQVMLILYWYIGNQLLDKIAQLQKGRKATSKAIANESIRQPTAQGNNSKFGQQPAAQITQQPVAQFGNERY